MKEYENFNNDNNEDNKISNLAKETEITYSDMIGKIKIEKINLELPILSHYTEELMKIAPTKYSGPNPNCIGNLVIIGHNYYDGTQFSDLDKLQVGDEVVIIDSTKNECLYSVYEKEVIESTDFSCLEENNDATKSFLTLVTCTNGTENRLLVKCEEKL